MLIHLISYQNFEHSAMNPPTHALNIFLKLTLALDYFKYADQREQSE